MPTRLGVPMALALASLTAAVPAGATAAPTKTQEQPTSSWVQPGTAPLDGVGTYVYVAAPPAGAGQGSPLAYEYTFFFSFEAKTSGFLALGQRQGQKLAGFTVSAAGNPVATVPFDWSFGHIYFLLTYRLGVDLWGGWIYDYSAASWTFIGQQPAAAGSGGLLPTSRTAVDYDPTLAPTPGVDWTTCASYPRVDAYFYPPIGWRGSTTTVAAPDGTTVYPGDCPVTITTEYGWQHYGMGVAPAA